MNEHVDSALDSLRWANTSNNTDQQSFHLKAAHVSAMLAVAAEIADLHQSIGAYLEASTHPLMKPAPGDDSWIKMTPVEAAQHEEPL